MAARPRYLKTRLCARFELGHRSDGNASRGERLAHIAAAVVQERVRAAKLAGGIKSGDGVAVPVQDLAAQSALEAAPRDCAALAQRFGLTGREREVLELIAQGRTNPYIANELGISPNTARNHVSNIYRKIGVYDRQQLLDVVNGRLVGGVL